MSNPPSTIGSVSVFLIQSPKELPEAANELFRRYMHLLWQYASFRLQGVRGVEADDIVQIVFSEFFRKAVRGEFPNMRNRKDFESWLFMICNFRVKDEWRKQTRLESTESVFGEMLGICAIADRRVIAIEKQLDLIRTELESMRTKELDPKLVEIFDLGLKRLSVKEIANELGLSKATIERRRRQIEVIALKFLDS